MRLDVEGASTGKPSAVEEKAGTHPYPWCHNSFCPSYPPSHSVSVSLSMRSFWVVSVIRNSSVLQRYYFCFWAREQRDPHLSFFLPWRHWSCVHLVTSSELSPSPFAARPQFVIGSAPVGRELSWQVVPGALLTLWCPPDLLGWWASPCVIINRSPLPVQAGGWGVMGEEELWSLSDLQERNVVVSYS